MFVKDRIISIKSFPTQEHNAIIHVLSVKTGQKYSIMAYGIKSIRSAKRILLRSLTIADIQLYTHHKLPIIKTLGKYKVINTHNKLSNTMLLYIQNLLYRCIQDGDTTMHLYKNLVAILYNISKVQGNKQLKGQMEIFLINLAKDMGIYTNQNNLIYLHNSIQKEQEQKLWLPKELEILAKT